MEYIENSGGEDYPFSTEGRVVRIATPEDHQRQAAVETTKGDYVAACKTLIRELDLPMKLVEVELLMGGEMATFFFMSESRVDFRGLVKHLAGRFRTRIQMHQVGAAMKAASGGRLRNLRPALLLQAVSQGAQTDLHGRGQDAEGHARPE